MEKKEKGEKEKEEEEEETKKSRKIIYYIVIFYVVFCNEKTVYQATVFLPRIQINFETHIDVSNEAL